MSRTEPLADLNWCESQVVIKAILSNGTTLRLGSATLTNVPEEDSNFYSYDAKIIKDSELRLSITQGANQMTLEAENVDKALGLTINDLSSTLLGAKVVCSKVFAPIREADIRALAPAFWYRGDNIRDVRPNEIFTQWNDLSGNGRHATGQGVFKWKPFLGRNGVLFDTSTQMSVPGSFPVAQVFAVFKTPSNVFSSAGSILGSSPSAFGFVSADNAFASPLPTSVREQGVALTSPFDLDLSVPVLANIQTNSPGTTRSYIINSLAGVRTNFVLTELIGFDTALSAAEEQTVEHILADYYGLELPYSLTIAWERKVMLVGQISQADNSEGTVNIRLLSDTAPNVAFFGARPVQTHCPLPFKSLACGYVGALTTCNKVFDSVDGCAGRNRQHRFQGLVIRGELGTVIPGGIDTTVGDDGRFWPGEYYPEIERNRAV